MTTRRENPFGNVLHAVRAALVKKMVDKQKQALRRPAVLEGISQNQTIKDIALKLGVTQLHIYRDINSMRYYRDPDFIKAQRMGQVTRKKEKALRVESLEEKFTKMTGKSIQEKSFENMVFHYKPELLIVLESGDFETGIKKLSLNTRRALVKAGLLNKKHTEITQKALDHLLAQILGIKTRERMCARPY